MAEMIRVTPSSLAVLPTLEFPFNKIPSIWAPERTVLRMKHGKRFPVFVWCHLDRSVTGPVHSYNPESLSEIRVDAMARAIKRISDHCGFNATGPRTAYHMLWYLGRFLAWIDGKEHSGRFEAVLSDPDLALYALELHHRYLKGMIQAHSIGRNSAANLNHFTLQALSIIHNRQYAEEVGKISAGLRKTKAPHSEDVARLISMLTSIFDSASRILESCLGAQSDGTWRLAISTTNDTVDLPKGYSRARLMELAAVSYAGLVICDSGANLAQIWAYEEPEDLWEQLAKPDRISLTQKVVKLRAGGKEVPVIMTALTSTRLKRFCEIRHQIIELLGSNDIIPLFFKCEYKHIKGRSPIIRHEIGCMEPVAVLPLSDRFLVELRKKVAAAGAELPDVTLRQLRLYKQQHVVRESGLKVAAEVMGHTIATAVKSYCADQEGVQANDMGKFLSSLHKTVLHRTQGRSVQLVSVPAGECVSHGNAKALSNEPLVEPDCKNMEGCFFCDNFRVHADERDVRKMLSCKNVLLKIRPLQGGFERVDRLYESVLNRIDTLLREIRLFLGAEAIERIESDIAAGNLTPYWAVKVQQLGVLGLICTETQVSA